MTRLRTQSLLSVDRVNPVNRSHRLNHGRVSWWLTLPGFTGGPKWFDLCRKNNGTLTNGPLWKGTSRTGGLGHLLFDGTDDDVRPPAFIPTNNFTLAAWFYTTTVSGLHAVISDSATICFVGINGSVLYGQIPGSTNGGTTLATNVWYRGAWVKSSTAGTVLYLNGVQNGVNAGATSNISPNSSQAIGSTTAGFRWSGAIDDVSVWSRALSAAEVKADYDLSRRGYPGVLRRMRAASRSAPSGGGLLLKRRRAMQ